MKGPQSQKPSFTTTVLIFYLCLTFVNGIELKFDENYVLDYWYDVCDGYLSFNLKTTNVTGWVAFGLNNKSSDMDGSDLLIAGWSALDGSYWGDYHVPANTGNSMPIRDKSQDWDVVQADQVGSDTTIIAYRYIFTGDTQEDIEIKDEPIHVLWAYNKHSDNVTAIHTHRSSVEVNLLAIGTCLGTSEGTTGDTESESHPSFPTTESTPGICPPTGTDLIEHPTSCTLYFVCVEGTAYEQECDDGLHFNPDIKACDRPENVQCTKPLPDCPPDGVSFHPYPGNCSLYVICAEGTPWVWNCAPETCFDPVELKCRLNDTALTGMPAQLHVQHNFKLNVSMNLLTKNIPQYHIRDPTATNRQELFIRHGENRMANWI